MAIIGDDFLGKLVGLGNAVNGLYNQQQQAMDYTAGLNKIYPSIVLQQPDPYAYEQQRQIQMKMAYEQLIQAAFTQQAQIAYPWQSMPQTQAKPVKPHTEDSAYAAMYGMSVEQYRKFNARRHLGIHEGQEVTNSQWLELQIESIRVRL